MIVVIDLVYAGAYPNGYISFVCVCVCVPTDALRTHTHTHTHTHARAAHITNGGAGISLNNGVYETKQKVEPHFADGESLLAQQSTIHY